jgi:glycopeptide antibiotics resistance protein
MNLLSILQSQSKAISAGIVTALVAEFSRFGFHAKSTTITAVGVIITAVVGYVIAHIAVYFAPKNSPKVVTPPKA